MIYTILASEMHNPHYLTKYITFITNCQAQNENYTGYTERHHICPKARDMFPEFTSFNEFPWNCAKLTPRQHYIAHLLLYKAYPRVVSQKLVLLLMNRFKNLEVTSKLYQRLRLEVVASKKGKVIVKDVYGSTFQVDKTDPRYLSGYLVPNCKGMVTVRDAQGNTFQVEVTDTRYLLGDLVHTSKGTTTVKDSLGKTFKVGINDPRFLSGELVGVVSGRISDKRAITEEQVQEIRLALKNPTSVITKEYLVEVVIQSQRDKVGEIPFSDLKYKNGSSICYRSIISKYYADKYQVTSKTIANIIDNKTYKEITT